MKIHRPKKKAVNQVGSTGERSAQHSLDMATQQPLCGGDHKTRFAFEQDEFSKILCEFRRGYSRRHRVCSLGALNRSSEPKSTTFGGPSGRHVGGVR
jgi:hypothetical protein